LGKIYPTRIGHVIYDACAGQTHCQCYGILQDMSQLITHERIGIDLGSSTLVDGLIMWSAVCDHWPRSKDHTYQQQERYK